MRGLRRTGRRAIELNGWQYWCYTGGSEPETPSHLQRRLSFEQPGDRLQERGENYLQALTFPEMRAGNRRLADVDPDTLSAADLAGHLGAALEWYERGWTLHWTRPREDARQRFGALYRELTGEEDASRWRDLLTDEPNKMSDAVEGLAALAASVREQPRLQALLAQESRPSTSSPPSTASRGAQTSGAAWMTSSTPSARGCAQAPAGVWSRTRCCPPGGTTPSWCWPSSGRTSG